MIVFSIFVFKTISTSAGKTAILLSSVYDVSSIGFMSRGTAREVLLFGNRQVATFSGAAHGIVRIPQNGASCHYTTGPNQVVCTVSTDAEYPSRIAFSLAGRALESFVMAHGDRANGATSDSDVVTPGWELLIKQYQDPVTADPIARTQKTIDETREILIETMDQLLKRGEKLSDLVDKSHDLSTAAKIWVHESERLNPRCCTIL